MRAKPVVNEFYTEGPATVIFRKYRNGDIVALFPYMITSLVHGWCECYERIGYEHIGQYGEADYRYMLTTTKPATPEEYSELKQELEAHCEYELRVVKRASRRVVEPQ